MTDQKNIRLNNGFWQVMYTVKKKDIDSKQDVDIKVVTKTEKEDMEDKERLSFWATESLIINDPSSPKI